MDSKKHRIFECKALDKVRLQHRDAVKFAIKQPKTYRLLGLPVWQKNSWLKLPHDELVTFQNVPLDQSGDLRHFFLDGSAFHQDARELTLSGWAIVESCPCVPKKFWVIDSGVVPGGEHSSYRGEALSVLRAIERATYSHQYSDCQAVVDNFRCIQVAVHNHLPCPNLDHGDIWGLVWRVLVSRGPNAHVITKVKAHCEILPHHSPFEKWLVQGNNRVDLAAKNAVRAHPLFSSLAEDYKHRTQYKLQYNKFVKFLCSLAEETFRILSDKKIKQSGEALQQAPTDFHIWLAPVSNIHFAFPDWDDLWVACPMGRVFYERVATWFRCLHWPQSHSPNRPGISLLELYVDFVVYSQGESPINDKKKGFKAEYYLLDSDPLLKETGAPLQKHTKSWMTFWKWVLSNQVVGAPLSWDCLRPVTHVGYSLRCGGFTIRPRLTNNESSMKWLCAYFHPSTGRRRNLSAPLRPWLA